MNVRSLEQELKTNAYPGLGGSSSERLGMADMR